MTSERASSRAVRAVAIAPLLILLCGLLGSTPLVAAEPPVVLYTDILSGPNSGGEDGKGAYLSIFGRNFGSSQGNSKVYINNVEVGSYKHWGASRGRPDVQQISVQPGPNVTSGAIKVVVAGQSSNTDHSFAVRPGDIYFVARNGNDDTGAIGDISKPYFDANGVIARSDFGPGDSVVVREGTYAEENSYDAFVSLKNKHGTPTDPLMILAYPGEDVIIHAQDRSALHLYSPDGSIMGGFVFAGFIRTEGKLAVFRKGDEHIAIINNETSGMHGDGGGSAPITGSGSYLRILGNNIHDNGDTKLYHGIYIDNDGKEGRTLTDIDIAFNHVWNQTGGRGIQVYWSEDNPSVFFNVWVHDNLVHDVALHAITLSKGSATGCKVYNNVVYNTGWGGEGTKGAIQTKSSAVEAEIYNNTVYDIPKGSAFDNQQATSVVLKNNIFHLNSGQNYYNADGGSWDNTITASNNVYFGSSQDLPSWESNAITGNPMFVNAAAADFHLQSGSSALNTGVQAAALRDHDGVARPQGGTFDCGAFEATGDVAPPTEPPAAPAGTPEVF